ncbi:MAG: hypothetical protein Q4B75_08150 [Eubacteriales bacterium]|nr:hypothetical protein [Eubacteriales bacterium]
MEETYWNKFWATGNVEDYLNYRGMQICADVMRRYDDTEASGTGEVGIESGNCDGNGNLIGTDWRI